MTMITLTAGTAFIMWLGEQITEKGIGNGISLIIFAGIVARMPNAIAGTATLVEAGTLNWFLIIILLRHGSRCYRFYRFYGNIAEKDTRPVRKEDCWAKDAWRTDDTSAAQGQYCGSYPSYIRVVNYYVPCDDCQFYALGTGEEIRPLVDSGLTSS